MKKTIHNPDICITGLGLVTSVGHDVITACSSMRAGLKRPAKLDNFYVESKKGFEEWEDGLVTGHPVLPPSYDDTKPRLLWLLEISLSDLREYSGLPDHLCTDTPLYLALPEAERNTLTPEDVSSFLWEKKESVPVHPESVKFYHIGHAGIIKALCDAVESITAGNSERAVIAGVDSLIGFNDLSRLNSQKRLFTELTPKGLIPGEASSAILIEKTSAAKKRNASIEALVQTISTDVEPHPVLSGKPVTGNGLANAIRVIKGKDPEAGLDVSAVISDLNGETCRFEEWALIQPKIMRHLTGEKHLICPARYIGDTGAASAGAGVCLAVRTMNRVSSAWPALILSSSDTGERGALYLKHNQAEETIPAEE